MNRSTVLIVEDEAALRAALGDTLKTAGFEVAAVDGGTAALDILRQREIGLVITDVRMDDMDGNTLLKRIRQSHARLPVLVITAYGTVQSAVEAMRDGAQDYLVKPFAADLLLKKVSHYLQDRHAGDGDVIAVDARMRELLAVAERVAGSDVTVMIGGESGTGKEVLARYLHRRSRRAARPFVAINCAAIPENMLEAMLFGYEKGAFTGAVQMTPGKFEQAQGGTLLLDEISEMSLALQAKLLRVLQEREIERLGGRRAIPFDVRVLCTSNRHLREEVAAGRFREDLFYRLNVFPLYLPPLRERLQDILPLARHFLACHARAAGRVAPALSAQAEARLLAHGWPGNVRELDNLIQRVLVLQSDRAIDAEDLSIGSSAGGETAADDGADDSRDGGGRATAASDIPVSRGTCASCTSPGTVAEPGGSDSLNRDLKYREQDLIIEALKAGNGSRKQAAERLGISPRTLRYKLARMRGAGIAVPG